MYSSLYKIITKLKVYDQSNEPSNSKLLQEIQHNRNNYPNFYI
jgi:hypothetical protein